LSGEQLSCLCFQKATELISSQDGLRHAYWNSFVAAKEGKQMQDSDYPDHGSPNHVHHWYVFHPVMSVLSMYKLTFLELGLPAPFDHVS